MTVRKLLGPVLMLSVALAACEEKSETDEAAPAAPAEKPAEPTPPKPAPPPEPSPGDICGQLTSAAKAKDEAKVTALTAKAAEPALGAEGAKEHVLAALGTVSCGSAKVEGDNATVPLLGGETPQEASFVKEGGVWKFDAAAYLTRYPAPEKEKPGKGKGKGKDHAKGKAAKGKHKKK